MCCTWRKRIPVRERRIATDQPNPVRKDALTRFSISQQPLQHYYRQQPGITTNVSPVQMPTGTSRRPPPRPPPVPNPLVESWLDSLPSSIINSSAQEFSHWRLNEEESLRRGWFIAGITLRALSLSLAIAITSITLSIIDDWNGGFVFDRMTSVLVVCPIIIIWDAAEFMTLCFHRDRGILPKIHAVLDGLLFLGAATTTAIILVDLIAAWGGSGFGPNFQIREVVQVCLLVILMLIHSFLFFFFICRRLDDWAKRRSDIRIAREIAEGAAAPPSEPDAPYTVDARQALMLQSLGLFGPQRVTTSSPGPSATPRKSAKHTTVQRKVTSVVNAPVYPCRDLKYQPGESEQARADRGEQQAQWIPSSYMP